MATTISDQPKTQTNLTKAHRQWAERPDDQRFWTLGEMHEATRRYFDNARVSSLATEKAQMIGHDENLYLVGAMGDEAKLTSWAFNQLCQRVGAPARYLSALPADLAATNLNHGLARLETEEKDFRLLRSEEDGLTVRAINGEIYDRIWNYEICERLMNLPGYWRVPPARPAHQGQAGARQATELDVLNDTGFSLSVNIGDWIAPAGLYASNEDMFAFLVDETHRINDGTDAGLARGFFVSNSEVGKATFEITTFLYRHVCGNHIVWDAEGVKTIRIVHVGDANQKAWDALSFELKRYAESSATVIEAKIDEARCFKLGSNQEDVIDVVYRKKGYLGKKAATASYDLAVKYSDVDGDPNTAWGFAQGVTRLSQEKTYTDARTELDRASGKILELAF